MASTGLISTWFSRAAAPFRRKGVATASLFALVIATPVTLAVLHHGFPVTDTDLYARDVWVTSARDAQAGRVNMQISEMNGFAPLYAADFNQVDVMQSGDDVFVYDGQLGRIERITPAFASLDQRIEVPSHSDVAYNANTLSIVRSVDGALWTVDTTAPLQFDPLVNVPLGEFGADAVSVVTTRGTIFVASPKDGALYRIDAGGGLPEKVLDLELGDFELTAVGERAWILDRDRNVVVDMDGVETTLESPALRIQQVGPARDGVVVATGDALDIVRGPDDVETIDAGVTAPVTKVDYASAPVVLGSCTYGAWTGDARFVERCEGTEPRTLDIPGVAPGDRGEFRVNRDAIVFNNFKTGDVFLVSENFRLVDNWDDSEPQDEPTTVDSEDTVPIPFNELIENRSKENHAPVARSDEFGVRPGKITVIPVLDNDIDEDGDVLVVAATTGVPATFGTLRTIEDGRALLFEPAEGATGTASFRYTASDGRAGGVSETTANLTIHPMDQNEPPRPFQTSTATVEAGAGTTYNVLSDWRDPDGDDLVLVGASTATSDVVQYKANGDVAFIHRSAELGEKTVSVTVSDGRAETASELKVTVAPSGSLAPIGVPDSVSTFTGTFATVKPLLNDLSPSGEQLSLVSVETLSGNATVDIDVDAGSFDVTANTPGTSYLKYTVAAGIPQSAGIVRVDVEEPPKDAQPPIAVPDTAYLRSNEPVTVAVLNNDVSPSGKVLGVQSVSVPDDARYKVELLDASLLRISAAQPLGQQETFTYTMSDGETSVVGGVTIVPVPELSKHQAPRAVPDTVTVRAGDIATVDVLANDYHPDGVHFSLDPELKDLDMADGGVLFASDGKLRVQAPSQAGQYVAVYGITDLYGEAATSSLTVTVTEPDPETNQPPAPKQLTARVYAGGSVSVAIPQGGADPDGDSVTLSAVSGPSLGMITARDSGGFEYQAFPDSAGTDEFVYVVEDAYGATSTATARIGVIPRAPLASPPNAVDDAVSVKPGGVVAVPVLQNDSDPNGYTIKLSPELLEVQDGVTARADQELVIIDAGLVEGTYGVRYQIENENGAQDSAFVTVKVDKNAPEQYPIAQDQVVEWQQAVGQKTYDIDPFVGALNPSGHANELEVSVEGLYSDMAQVLDDGTIRVTLTDERRAIAYRLTNLVDGLSAQAFLVVPKYYSDFPPELWPDLDTQIVPMNTTVEWKISDLAYAPSGKPIIITNADMVSGTRTNGDPVYKDATTLRYTPEHDYRGPASVTFEVTDGTSENDPEGVSATLVLPIIVGDPEYRDYPPSFTPAEILIEAGEKATTFNLRGASSHPNPKIKNSLAYTGLSGTDHQIKASISGGELKVSAPFGTQPGTKSVLSFDVGFGDFLVPGQVTVRVVPSTRPLAKTSDDVEPEGRMLTTYVMPVLDNDFNPFAKKGQPLKVVDAQFDGDNLGATLSFNSSSISITTGGTVKSGTINVIYTVRDATDTKSREVTGRASVIVASAPEPVPSFTVARGGSGEIVVVFQGSPSSNGAPIQYYTVNVSGQPGATSRDDCSAGASCVFTGRTNGQQQTVSVTVTNRVGTTGSSGTKNITPYGTPSAPRNPYLSGGSTATASIRGNWSTPSTTGGGSITYEWAFTQGSTRSGTTTGTSGSYISVGAGTYRFQVRACNPAGCSSWVGSGGKTITNPPPATFTLSQGGYQQFGASWAGWGSTIQLRNYPANRTYTVSCYSRRSGSWSTNTAGVTGAAPSVYSVTTNSSGSATLTSCLWGFSSSGYPGYALLSNGNTTNTVTFN